MFSAATKSFRTTAAVTMAIVYALCIVAPSAAFAFAGNDAVAHCLTDDLGLMEAPGHKIHHHAVSAFHVHADNVVNHTAAGSKEPAHDGNGHATECCGLFSVVALVGKDGIALAPLRLTSVPFSIMNYALSGRGGDRINRPPIA